jgi:hypothetical protein
VNLLQLLVFTPVSMAVLEAATAGSASFRESDRARASNPIVIGSALGTAVSVSGIDLPPIVFEPALLIGQCVRSGAADQLRNSPCTANGSSAPSGRRRDIFLARG